MYSDLALYIDGKWVNGGGRKGEDVINPGDRKAAGAAAACEHGRSRRGAGGCQERLRAVAHDPGPRPRQDHPQGRRPHARAPRCHLKDHGAGAGQGLCRGTRGGVDLMRHPRLVRRGGPPQLRPHRTGPRQGHAPAGGAGTGRGGCRLHALELPGADAGAQDRRCAGGGLLAHSQGFRGDAGRLRGDGALLRRGRSAGRCAQSGVRRAGAGVRASACQGGGAQDSRSPARSRSASISPRWRPKE